MFKNTCITILTTLICIYTFAFVNLTVIRNTEELIGASSTVPELKPAKISAPIKPMQSIDEPVEPVEPVQPVEEIIYAEPTTEEKLSELSIADIYAKEAEYLAKTVWGEARGCSTTEQAAVIWCILNRVDSKTFPNDIIKVITQKNQFCGYKSSYPVTDEFYELAIDIIGRWELEKAGNKNVGRILPNNYYYFHGDGKHNYFRAEYRGRDYWDWSLESPYEN